MKISGVKKIAVVRANGLGDFIFALPALTALRHTYPDATIYYLGKWWHKLFLEERKSPIDKIIVLPPIRGVGMPEIFKQDNEHLKEFYHKMQQEQFDIAIQLHGGGAYSNAFVKQLHACYTIGSKTKDAADLDFFIPYYYYQNEYARLLEVVSLVGAKTNDPMPHISVTKQDQAEAFQLLRDHKKKLIVLHPGATDIRRRWPKERFIAVGKYFSDKGFRIAVTGSGDEEVLVENICKDMASSAENMCNKLSLNGLTGLLSSADLVISNDTGPLHLAEALGCKTVGIYWCGNMLTASPLFRQHTIALSSWTTHCPLCNKNFMPYDHFQEIQNTACDHQVSFVTDITTEEVIGAAKNLLSDRQSSYLVVS